MRDGRAKSWLNFDLDPSTGAQFAGNIGRGWSPAI
jgi:hypothetical protein